MKKKKKSSSRTFLNLKLEEPKEEILVEPDEFDVPDTEMPDLIEQENRLLYQNCLKSQRYLVSPNLSLKTLQKKKSR